MTHTVITPPAPVEGAPVTADEYLRQMHASLRQATDQATRWMDLAAQQQRFIDEAWLLLGEAPPTDGRVLSYLNSLRAVLGRARQVRDEAPDGAR